MVRKIKKQYHYSIPMEMVAWEFYGYDSSAHGMASAYTNPIFFKNQCLKFVKKIRKRINEIITNDEFFRDCLLSNLEVLRSRLKKVTKDNNEIDIIASLFEIIALLLGWGYFEGDFFRTPIYYQTEEQKAKTLNLLVKTKSPFELAYQKRRLILQLRKEGRSYQEISAILNITDTSAKQLENAKHIDEMYKNYIKKGHFYFHHTKSIDPSSNKCYYFFS